MTKTKCHKRKRVSIKLNTLTVNNMVQDIMDKLYGTTPLISFTIMSYIQSQYSITTSQYVEFCFVGNVTVGKSCLPTGFFFEKV